MASEEFNKPLDKWVEEEVPVTHISPVFTKVDGDKLRVDYKSVTSYQKQKTKYVNAPPERIGCAKGHHQWYMEDKHKYVAGCRFCLMKRILSPFDNDIQDGKIIHFKTGMIE